MFSAIDDLSGMFNEQLGIRKQVVFSGKFKTLGADFRPLSGEERAIVQADVEALHDQLQAKVILAARAASGPG